MIALLLIVIVLGGFFYVSGEVERARKKELEKRMWIGYYFKEDICKKTT